MASDNLSKVGQTYHYIGFTKLFGYGGYRPEIAFVYFDIGIPSETPHSPSLLCFLNLQSSAMSRHRQELEAGARCPSVCETWLDAREWMRLTFENRLEGRLE